jgi:N-acetylmuramoyl-L-alanine amidase
MPVTDTDQQPTPPEASEGLTAERREAVRERARRSRRVATGFALSVTAAGVGTVAALALPGYSTLVKVSAGGTKSSTIATRAMVVPRPPIVWKPIPFGAKRRAEMADYAERHYGFHRWQLRDPKVIVEHYTANESFSATWNTFANDAPDPELKELPGDCAHFVIDTDGTIYQLVPLNTMCRHTVGLNWTAIGIEHVGDSDQQILDDPRQLAASLSLTLWLMSTYHIQLRNVIGHNESLTSPYHHEAYAPWRCQTHGDWDYTDMQIYRADVRSQAAKYAVPLGPPGTPVSSGC